ncbi:hypothetical protein ABID22_000629 [Pontibacter aydingkolensis]
MYKNYKGLDYVAEIQKDVDFRLNNAYVVLPLMCLSYTCNSDTCRLRSIEVFLF